MINCNECKHISLTEEEQIDKRIDHICLKHKTKLLHGSCNPHIFHDQIYPCANCNGRDFEERNKKYIGPQVGSDEDVEWTPVCSGDVANITPSFIYGVDFPISDSISKTQIIERLKFYMTDYELTESDDSMRKVINWFINCTPGYDGWFV